MRKEGRGRLFYVLLALFMTGIMFSGGCGRQEVNESKEYSAFFSDLQMPSDVYCIQKIGSAFYATYFDSETKERHYYEEIISGNVSSTELLTSSAAYQEIIRDSVDYFVDKDINFYIILLKETESARTFYLCKFTKDGQELFREKLPVFMNEEDFHRIVVDDAGMICVAASDLHTSSHLYFYDQNGIYQGELAVADGFRAFGIGKNGNVYYVKMDMTSGSDGALVEVDCEKKEVVNAYHGYPEELGFGLIYLMPGIQHDFLVIVSDCLYGYQLESQTCEPLIEWEEYALISTAIAYVGEEENGDILAVVNYEDGSPGEFVRFTDKNKIADTPESVSDTGESGTGSVDRSEREILTLGITCVQVNTSYYEELRNNISQFNRMQDQYWVEIKIYGDEKSISYTGPGPESRDGMNAMNLEMAAGNGPDLIYWNSNFAIYAHKELLEDLSSYLETSEILSREDYLESAVNMFTVDDRLLALPAYLGISTCYGYTDQIGEDTELGFEEMLKLNRKYEDIPLFEIQQYPDSALVFLADTVYSFIDWEKGACTFDSREFQLFLEYCNSVKDNEIDTWFSQLGEDYLIKMAGGNSAISIIEATKEQRDITFIGYPTWEGSRTYIDDMAAGYCIGISTKSKHKEGAWEFLEYLHGSVLAGDYSIHSGTRGFPARKSYLEKYLSELVGTKNTVSGIEYIITEEDTNFVMELLTNAAVKSTKMHSSIVLDIIREEAAAYFAGDKPVDVVAGIIQNRIQLYLSENY